MKVLLLITVLVLFVGMGSVQAQEACVYYFYGDGCPHCANVKPFLEEMEVKYPGLQVERFEIYNNGDNAQLLDQYFDYYGVGVKGVPIVFTSDTYFVGDQPILEGLEGEILRGGECPSIGGEGEGLTLAKLVSLAAVDAVNPCALAVLTLMLMAILTYNPRKKNRVLLAGISFSIAVFIMYFLYGLVIIKFFQVVQALTAVRLFLYTILGFVAIGLGLYEIRDYFHDKGCLLCRTDAPGRLSRIAQKVISGVTSPQGAFVVGILVTVFLLPCTIGPYIIAGGLLSFYEILAVVPSLLLYNLIFIMPMIAITLVIYFGIAKIEDVDKWKDKNMKYLHLIAGSIILLLGIAMVLGWV
jgi:thiol-disulfide isomerase/thioredoxin